MSEFIIEKGIPLPERRKRQAKIPRYPVDKMEIGDSVFFPIAISTKNPKEATRTIGYMRSICKSNGKNYGFAYRVEGDGFRIWRTR